MSFLYPVDQLASPHTLGTWFQLVTPIVAMVYEVASSLC